MKISPNKPFDILDSNFFDCEVRLPKHTNIAQTAEPPSIINAINMDDQKASPIGTADASTNLKFNSPADRANTQASQQTDV